MNVWRRWVWGGILCVMAMVGLPGAAVASSEVDSLLNKLVDKGVLTASEAQEIRNEISPAQAKSEKALDERISDGAKKVLPEWAANWNWKGDIRLRNELNNKSGRNHKNRQRIRFRYGFEAKANDQLTVGARMATGNTSDPISTNQSFDSSFNHKTIVLDQAYVHYTPQLPGLSALKLSGGILPNPYWHQEQLVWDDDLNFDGVNLRLEENVGPLNLFANGGVFSLNTNIVHSSALWAVQGGGSIQPLKGSDLGELAKHLKLTAAVAYYDYMNVTGKASDSTALTNAGGLKGASSDLKDWNLLNPNLAIETTVAGVPVGFYGDWVHNTAAFDNANGYLAGFKIGKAKKPFFSFANGLNLKDGWEAGYDFEHLENNGTFGAFANSDFGGGGTNHRGNVYWLKFAALKNSTLGLTVLQTRELSGTKNQVDTYQMDWVTSF